MKPSYTTTLSREPQGDREGQAADALLDAVTVCYRAFKLRRPIEKPPEGLEELLDEKRERIIREVASCTRTVAFIGFHGSHASADITFSEGRTAVKVIRITFTYEPQKLVFVSEASYPAI